MQSQDSLIQLLVIITGRKDPWLGILDQLSQYVGLETETVDLDLARGIAIKFHVRIPINNLNFILIYRKLYRTLESRYLVPRHKLFNLPGNERFK